MSAENSPIWLRHWEELQSELERSSPMETLPNSESPAGESETDVEDEREPSNDNPYRPSADFAALIDALKREGVAYRKEEQREDRGKRIREWITIYAVEKELWRIDASKPALRFNVLSRPTQISRQATAIKSAGPITEAKKLQLDFWTLFRDGLLEKKIVTSAQTPRPQYWFDVSLGRSNLTLSCIANTSDGRIGLRVYLGNKIADIALPQLEAQRATIEAEIGEPLKWNPFPEKLDKIIVLDRPADLEDRAKWGEYITWLIERVDKFKKAFGPRVRNIQLN